MSLSTGSQEDDPSHRLVHTNLIPIKRQRSKAIVEAEADLSPKVEAELRKLLKIQLVSQKSLEEFCSKEGIHPALVAKMASKEKSVFELTTKSNPNESSPSFNQAIMTAIAKLQEGQVRLTRRIYGVPAAKREAQNIGWNKKVRYSKGELRVIVCRKARHENSPPSVELLILRNGSTTLASIEVYVLSHENRWTQTQAYPAGSPLLTMLKHVESLRQSLVGGQQFDTVSVDAAGDPGTRPFAECFCKETFEIGQFRHSRVECILQNLAAEAIQYVETDPSIGAIMGLHTSLHAIVSEYDEQDVFVGKENVPSQKDWRMSESHEWSSKVYGTVEDVDIEAERRGPSQQGVSSIFQN